MVYWNGQRYVPSAPTFIPDVRAHLANWQRFRTLTSTWPLLSIVAYLLRFIIMIAGVVVALWYGVRGHGWGKGQYYLTSLAVVIPVLFLWFILERKAWNRDLQRGGLASANDVWSVTQFPEK